MKQLIKDNIRLRPLRPTDASRLAELANNEKISINLRDGFPNPYTLNDAENFIKTFANHPSMLVLAIEFDGLYAGNISLSKGTDVYRKSAEIGYFIGEPYWNKGIMTKAVNLITEYGFNNLDIVRIYTGVFEYNHASQRVLEKCGFIKEAVFEKAICKNNKLYSEIRYSKTK